MDPNQVPSTPPGNAIAILAYLGLLIIIPFLTDAKNDPFVKFHIKQGLVLIIAEVILWIISSMLMSSMYFFGGWMIYNIIWLFIVIMAVIGIINVLSGKQKALPLIGHFASRFNF